MKEMANIQTGMSFYGEMPNMYNVVLNCDHQLVKNIINDEEAQCAASVQPIQQQKDDEIPQADKDKVNELDKQWDELKKQKENLYAEYASKNPQVKQLIDLALLQNGLLKGEALSNFIKRSIELMK